jgi:hypothetical protein
VALFVLHVWHGCSTSSYMYGTSSTVSFICKPFASSGFFSHSIYLLYSSLLYPHRPGPFPGVSLFCRTESDVHLVAMDEHDHISQLLLPTQKVPKVHQLERLQNPQVSETIDAKGLEVLNKNYRKYGLYV